MGLLDGILGQIGGSDQVAGLAGKLGLSAEQVQSAMAALGKAHAEPGDTVEAASASTGLPTDKLNELVAGMGGEGALGKLKQFALEGSNVQVVEEMVDMIAAQRTYEMNTKVLSAADNMLQYLAQAAR